MAGRILTRHDYSDEESSELSGFSGGAGDASASASSSLAVPGGGVHAFAVQAFARRKATHFPQPHVIMNNRTAMEAHFSIAYHIAKVNYLKQMQMVKEDDEKVDADSLKSITLDATIPGRLLRERVVGRKKLAKFAVEAGRADYKNPIMRALVEQSKRKFESRDDDRDDDSTADVGGSDTESVVARAAIADFGERASRDSAASAERALAASGVHVPVAIVPDVPNSTAAAIAALHLAERRVHEEAAARVVEENANFEWVIRQRHMHDEYGRLLPPSTLISLGRVPARALGTVRRGRRTRRLREKTNFVNSGSRRRLRNANNGGGGIVTVPTEDTLLPATLALPEAASSEGLRPVKRKPVPKGDENLTNEDLEYRLIKRATRRSKIDYIRPPSAVRANMPPSAESIAMTAVAAANATLDDSAKVTETREIAAAVTAVGGMRKAHVHVQTGTVGASGSSGAAAAAAAGGAAAGNDGYNNNDKDKDAAAGTTLSNAEQAALIAANIGPGSFGGGNGDGDNSNFTLSNAAPAADGDVLQRLRAWLSCDPVDMAARAAADATSRSARAARIKEQKRRELERTRERAVAAAAEAARLRALEAQSNVRRAADIDELAKLDAKKVRQKRAMLTRDAPVLHSCVANLMALRDEDAPPGLKERTVRLLPVEIQTLPIRRALLRLVMRFLDQCPEKTSQSPELRVVFLDAANFSLPSKSPIASFTTFLVCETNKTPRPWIQKEKRNSINHYFLTEWGVRVLRNAEQLEFDPNAPEENDEDPNNKNAATYIKQKDKVSKKELHRRALLRQAEEEARLEDARKAAAKGASTATTAAAAAAATTATTTTTSAAASTAATTTTTTTTSGTPS